MHDVDQEKLTIVEVLRVISSSTLSEADQKELNLAICTPERSVIGFNQSFSYIKYLMQAKKSTATQISFLNNEVKETRSENGLMKDKLAKLQNENQTQAAVLRVSNITKEQLATDLSNVKSELEQSKEQNKETRVLINFVGGVGNVFIFFA